MNLSAGFIRRPVATSLLMAAVVALGVAGYLNLPVAALPNVDFPTIQVTAQLPGADAKRQPPRSRRRWNGSSAKSPASPR